MRKIFKNDIGITLIALSITIIVMMIIAGITVNLGLDLIQEVKLQDLRTNMLLMQAKGKECVEEVSFQKANVTDENENQTIKDENLKGTKVDQTQTPEVWEALQKTGKMQENYEYYYLTEQDLSDMGIQELSVEDYGYFILGYNIEEIKVEVINTTGYQGNYTLTQLNELSGEE